MRLLALAAAAAAASSAGALAAPKPCFDRLNGEPFETVCYRLLANASGGLLTVREYAGTDADAQLVTFAAPATVTVYQEALLMTGFYVIDYFTNHSLLSSRTVPITLRPPTSAQKSEWVGQMALAPSQWPPAAQPPAPDAPTALAPRGNVTLASLRETFQQSPQPSDFDGLCERLRAAVPSELPAWTVDEASPVSPTHARFFGEAFTGPWECECWVGVVKA
jgi:hypothetical protein